MDTPNTRSRRKRELDDQENHDEGCTVRWAQDQRLRRMMAEDAVGVPIPLPSPTQRLPLRICPQGSSSSTAGPSTRPTRKRPCRTHRSLPSQLSSLATPDPPYPAAAHNGRSSSLPTSRVADQGSGILDDLLDRAFKTFSVQSPSLAVGARRSSSGVGSKLVVQRSSSSGSSSATNVGVVPRRPGVSAAAATTAAPARAETVPNPSRSAALSEHPVNTVTTNRPVTRRTPSKTAETNLANNDRHSITTKDILSAPVPYPPTTRAAPRVGLYSRTIPAKLPDSSIPRLPAGLIASNSTSRFKPPLMQPPIRCSPRRLAQAQAQRNSTSSTSSPQTPSRLSSNAASKTRMIAPAAVTAGHGRRPDTTLPSRDNSTGHSLRVQKELPDAPSSDSAGNDSFDSFDGMFEAGGDDVEAFLRAVDGSE